VKVEKGRYGGQSLRRKARTTQTQPKYRAPAQSGSGAVGAGSKATALNDKAVSSKKSSCCFLDGEEQPWYLNCLLPSVLQYRAFSLWVLCVFGMRFVGGEGATSEVRCTALLGVIATKIKDNLRNGLWLANETRVPSSQQRRKGRTIRRLVEGERGAFGETRKSKSCFRCSLEMARL
jgi:hypothetical protein